MVKPLSAADKATIAAASPNAMERRAGSVRRYMADHGRWLGSRNRYRAEPIQSIKRDLKAGGLNDKHAAEYVVASAPLHASDGWGYLGRALHAHVAGNPDVARHLAYYAELRAAMSLLATQGIGIFDWQHFAVVADSSTVTLASRSTHQAVWLYLEAWAQSRDASSLLGSVIRPEGEPLDQWITALPRYPSWVPVGQDWLLKLGLDLKRIGEDQAARNKASYRPTSLSDAGHLRASEVASFVVDFVSLLEPQAPGIFNRLDAHFLRISIETAFEASTNNTPRQAAHEFHQAVTTVTEEMVHDSASVDNILRFLTRQFAPTDPVIIAEASGTDLPTHPRHHLQVMCRAALLLRVASGAVAHLLRAAGLTSTIMSPWWTQLGTVRGLWHTAPPPEDLIDLWLDVAGGLEEIRDWQGSIDDPTHRALLDDCAQPLARVTALEGVALVGMAT